jgi:hypothetical protein
VTPSNYPLRASSSSFDQKFEAYFAKGDTILAVASMGVDPLVSKTTELLRLDKMPTFSQVKNGEKGIFDVDIATIAV